MISRRALLVTLAGGILVAPRRAHPQPARRSARIAYLGYEEPPSEYVEALRQGLRALGYVEGQDFVIEARFARWNAEALDDLARELAGFNPNVAVCYSGPAVRAASRAMKAVPIVMAVSPDPVEAGFIASLAKPGGNITGLTFLAPELGPKRLELLNTLAPQATRIAVFSGPLHPGEGRDWREIQAGASVIGVDLLRVELRRTSDVEDGFAAVLSSRAHGVVVIPEPISFLHRERIAAFALKARLPVVAGWKDYTTAGGLLSYGPDRADILRRASTYVDRILKGAKPANLPVEQPTKFELVINLKTARALGLTIPPSLLLRADQVIE